MSLWEMSLTGSVLILVILTLRALTLHRLPKTTFLALWGVTAVRLLVPYTLPSPSASILWPCGLMPLRSPSL